MTVKIDFTETDLQPAIQSHLDGGPAIRSYIVAAVRYFNKAREAEKDGTKVMGYGDAGRFRSYNTVLSPKEFLAGVSEVDN